MLDTVIGLVCEGVTDYIIFEKLVGDIARKAGMPVSFRRFHPAQDATSGQVESGGWLTVFQWCVRNTPERRRPLFSVGSLFQTAAAPCDLILVHLDTDICERLAQSQLEVLQHVFPAEYDLTSPIGRGSFIKAVIAHWLQLRLLDEEFRAKHIPAPAVECSEAWLIASRADITSPEDDRTIMEKFITIVCETLKQKTPELPSSFTKNPHRYRRFIQRSETDALLVRQKCHHFNELCSIIFGT